MLTTVTGSPSHARAVLPFARAVGAAGHEVVGERGASRVHPRGPVHATAWMRRGRGQEQPGDTGLRPPETRHWAQHELLVQLRGAAVEGADDEVGVARLQLVGPEDPASDDA